MEKKFIDKPFKECEGGYYDENNFYITPNGSFWDPDGVYFNKEGLDRHGGYYDDNLEYQPGRGWIKELMCYEDERGSEDNVDDDDEDNDDILDELYINSNMDVIEKEEVDKKKGSGLFKPGMKDMKKSNNNDNKEKIIETVITPDMLFNKIPETIMPKDVQKEEKKNVGENVVNDGINGKVKTMKKVELDDLFS